MVPWLSTPFETLEAAYREGRLGHAWLFAGPRGIGKLNLALVLAERLLTGASAEPLPAVLDAETAGAAMRERRQPSDHHPDLHWLHPEVDKSTIGVEQIRELSESLVLKGFGGACKVVVIEPAEAMTVAAANALLKTLEEPTAETFLFLISHQPGRLMRTIRSRCQVLALAPPGERATRAWLGPGDYPGSLRAPLRLAETIDDIIDNKINELQIILDDIYHYRVEPQSIAEAWSKLDLELLLETLVERLQDVLRMRFLASNSITDPTLRILHNAWPALTLERLFAQLDAAERLREQLGTGINSEMALRVLLLGFQPDREPS